jgi:hypothetical protein
VFFIQITDLGHRLLVPNPEIFDQLAHIIHFVLEVLVVRFDQHYFFLFPLFLLNQKLFTLPLLVKLGTQFTVFLHAFQLTVLDLLGNSGAALDLHLQLSEL